MIDALHFSSVSYRFPEAAGRPVALDGLSLDCHPGTVTCLVGPNGAGKSTILALAAGLLEASAGRILQGSQGVGRNAPPTLMGYLPQQSRFPCVLRVGEVLEFAFAARATPATGRAEMFALTGLAPVLPHRVGTLSSGWIRRLGLAVALAAPSGLLLLDEPFAGLDLDTLDRLVVHLRGRVAEGSVVVLSSHDFEVIDELDAIVAVLDEGRLHEVGPLGAESSRRFYRHVLKGDVQAPAEPRRIYALGR